MTASKTGPRGRRGSQGDQGEKGEAGEQGSSNRVTLGTLDLKLDHVLLRLNEHATQDRIDFTAIEHSLGGNNGEPGIIIRLDRIEQVENSRRWHIRAIWGAGFCAFAAWLVTWILGS